VQKFPAEVGHLWQVEQGEQNREENFVDMESGPVVPRSNEVKIFLGVVNEGASKKEANGIYGKEDGLENNLLFGEKKMKTRGPMGFNGAGSGGKNTRVVQTWKRRARVGQQ
jgi:hypothetical protein